VVVFIARVDFRLKKINLYVFIAMLTLTILVVLTPLLLKEPFINHIVSYYLEELHTTEYKSVYITLLGGFMGSWLAITGAIWTQRKFENNRNEVQLKESALIVYYDFDFAFNDIKRFMEYYKKSTLSEEGLIDKKNKPIKMTLTIFIDSDWIYNVAKLNTQFNKKEIKQIYEIYGYLNYVKNIVDVNSNKIDFTNAKTIYDFSMLKLYKIFSAGKSKFILNDINNELMEQLNQFISK